MKCEDVQFLIQADPREVDADAGAMAHVADCADCQAVLASARAFDGELQQALHLNPPEGLRSRLQQIPYENDGDDDAATSATNKVVSIDAAPKKRSWTAWGGYAIAASLILGIGLVNLKPFGSPGLHAPGGASVGQLIHHHLSYHGGPELAQHTVAAADIQRHMRDFGIRVDVPGVISSIERCPIGDTYGLHMVYRSEHGPVTFIYMPDIDVSQTQDFNYDGMKGVIRPAPVGSMAIIGDSRLNLQQTEVELKQGIEWL